MGKMAISGYGKWNAVGIAFQCNINIKYVTTVDSIIINKLKLKKDVEKHFLLVRNLTKTCSDGELYAESLDGLNVCNHNQGNAIYNACMAMQYAMPGQTEGRKEERVSLYGGYALVLHIHKN